MEEKNQKEKMEKMPKQEPSLETKKKKAKIAIISLSAIVVLFVSLQVYASTNGYGNVFFMIKEWVTGQSVSGKEEIFSDQDITLSYKSIELAEGLKIQVNRLELKENESTICLNITNEVEDNELLPLHYVVRAERPYSEGGYIPIFRPEAGNVTFDGNKGEVGQYIDLVNVPCKFEGNEIINLDVQDKSGKSLKNIEINLETREITVTGEEEFEKISEIELTKYLDAFSLLKDKSGYTESDNLIEIAAKMQSIVGKGKVITTEREYINGIVKSFYGENAKFETTKNAQGKDVEVLKKMKVGVYEKQSDTYDLMEHDRFGKCLKIEDINYENDIYTVKFIYLIATGEDKSSDNLENLPQYETTIKLRKNDDTKYSKYQIVSIEEGKEIKEKVSTKVNEEEKTEEDTNINNNKNIVETMKWTRYEAAGISFEYPSDFTATESGIVTKNSREGLLNTLATGVVPDSENKGKTKLRIQVYHPNNVESNVEKYHTSKETYLTDKNGEKWYSSIGQSDIDGYEISNSYSNFEDKGNGQYLMRQIEFFIENDNNDNMKYILEHIVCSIQKTEVPDTTTTSSTKEYTDSTNWVQVWPEWVGMKFKLPVGFTQEPIVKNYKSIYVDFKGNVTLAHWNKEAETFPVTIRFWNEFDDNLKEENVLINDLDRNVKSTDNKGWTDWKPLQDEYKPAVAQEQGYIRRCYGRIRDDQIEKVIFDMKTTGIDVDHYKFMNNVLSSISSTSV